MTTPDWVHLATLPSLVVTGADLDRVDLLQRGLLRSPLTLTAAGERAMHEAKEFVVRDPEGTPLLVVTVDGDRLTAETVRPVEPTLTTSEDATLAVVVLGPLTPDDQARISERVDGHPRVLWLVCSDRSPHGRARGGQTSRATGLWPGHDHRVVRVPWPRSSSADLFAGERPSAADLAEAHGREHLIVGAEDHPLSGRGGAVVFFTGLSGAGKSTIAKALRDLLASRDDRPVTLLDGDEVRRRLSPDLGFDEASRAINVQRVSWVASLLAGAGGIAITALIAPFDELRAEARAMAGQAGAEFIEVWVSTPLEACEERDQKGLYARARTGAVQNFTGISSPYEEPSDPELVIDTTLISAADAATLIAEALETVGGSR